MLDIVCKRCFHLVMSSNRTARRTHQPRLICPHCGSHNTERLPGGVVAECLNPPCGWAFNADAARTCPAPVARVTDTHSSIRPELINPPAGQQELPL